MVPLWDGRGGIMRFVALLLACVGVLLAVTGCDPIAERRYINEGAGVELYTADRSGQIALQNQYVDFVCQQAGAGCGADWTAFVWAGMNDIDLRCDGYLTWLDARRRDKEPILAELSALNTAAHSIMTVTGSSPKSLDIVTAAFGLASATYSNWNSRLMLAVNQSTVQEIVYTSQFEFRKKIKNYRVPDQPTAIYLLRNYLRLCMPITIEASINTSATLVQRGDTNAAKKNLVVSTTVPRTLVIRNAAHDVSRDRLRAQLYPNGAPPADQELVAYIGKLLGKKKVSIGTILRTPQLRFLRQKISLCIDQLKLKHACPDNFLAHLVK